MIGFVLGAAAVVLPVLFIPRLRRFVSAQLADPKKPEAPATE